MQEAMSNGCIIIGLMKEEIDRNTEISEEA